MKILKGIEKLAVDANPLLSAIIGGNARNIFLSATDTMFYTTIFNFKEVEKYIPVFAKKRGIPPEDLYMALSLLPIIVCNERSYHSGLARAFKLIGKKDPDDAHLLALSLKLNCPIWSNDKDFAGSGITIYSTIELLKG